MSQVEGLEDRHKRAVITTQGGAFVARPIAAAYMNGCALQGRAVNDLIDKLPREAKLMFGAAFLAERAAHEAAAVFGAGKNDLGQHRLIDLHQSRADRQEIVKLFAQDLHDV